MASEEYVDWRGNAVDAKKHGGIKATLFLYVLVVLRSFPNSANFTLVAYLHGTLHLGIVSSSTVITFLVGAVSVFASLMNFISNGYIKRSTAIFVFGPLVILGYMLLALQAHLPSFHPQACDINKEPNNCEPAQGWKLALLYLSLLMFAVGEGCLRACTPSLCQDQFSSDAPNESWFKCGYLIIYNLANSLGTIFGLAFLAWIENNLGWTIGFLVIVTAFNKRRSAIHDSIDLQEIGEADRLDGEENFSTKKKMSLDKKCIYVEDKSPWSFRSSTHLEESRVVLQMLPIFISSLLILLPFTLLMTLTIQVGSSMDRRIGTLQISSASLIAIPTAFHMLMQPLYGQILTRLLKRLMGHEHSITPLQRLGAGSMCGSVTACNAALVETKRIAIAKEHSPTERSTGVPMSVFWLVIQFFLLSVMELTSSEGLLEFVRKEAPPSMKPIAPAVQSGLVGSATWSACIFIQLVSRATRYQQEDGRGWLDGSNFNHTHLGRFFFLLAAFEFVALINYAYWAKKYVNKNHKDIIISRSDDENPPHMVNK